MTGSHTSSNRSNTPTPSLDGSQSSTTSRKRMLRNSTSALGLDKMIDEKRDAKTMSERVVHIEVCLYILFWYLLIVCWVCCLMCEVCESLRCMCFLDLCSFSHSNSILYALFHHTHQSISIGTIW